jgi:nucleoid-associated protein YgaU
MLLFSWGTFQFICLLESVGQRFTHFLPSGTPVRAYLKLSFIECPEGGPKVSSGGSGATATVHQARQGETMSQIAARTTGDPRRWREIAEANNIDNPRKMEAGRALVLPPGTSVSRPGRT